MENISNIRVGKPQISPSKPSHIRGVHEGNEGGRDPGMHRTDGMLMGSARRSTGINAKSRNPIDPRSPKLSPA
jgi:hypothetical protein